MESFSVCNHFAIRSCCLEADGRHALVTDHADDAILFELDERIAELSLLDLLLVPNEAFLSL